MPAVDVVPPWAWLVLALVVVLGLTVDLVGHRGDRGGGRRRAMVWSAAWIALAAAFGGWVAIQFGARAAGEFATSWAVEKSLSVDNLFVFFIVFERLRVPEREQHRVLFWGILGALVTRGAFIAAGVAAVSSWRGVLYPMGAFLIFTSVKTLRSSNVAITDEELDAADGKGEGRILAFVRRRLPYTAKLHDHRFVVTEGGRRLATPLLLALIAIELSDVVFALDSIPAVLSVTADPFIVYSSNVFAILGLRALYLVLATLLAGLRFLRIGIAAVLAFAGLKMITASFVEVPHFVSLTVIVGILLVTVLASVAVARAERRRTADG